MRTQLNREHTMEVLLRTRSKNMAARELATSRYTLERHLELWGETVEFTRGQMKEANRDVHKPGDRVLWRPSASRTGYFGLPEGIEPWPCVVISGPFKPNHYQVKYAGESRKLRTINKTYEVLGTRLFRENT